MLRRVGVAISVGLADSLNPSTAGPAPYLATVRNRVWRVTQFTIGVFSVTLAGGLVLTIGPGRLLLGLGTRRLRAPDPRRVTLRLIQRGPADVASPPQDRLGLPGRVHDLGDHLGAAGHVRARDGMGLRQQRPATRPKSTDFPRKRPNKAQAAIDAAKHTNEPGHYRRVILRTTLLIPSSRDPARLHRPGRPPAPKQRHQRTQRCRRIRRPLARDRHRRRRHSPLTGPLSTSAMSPSGATRACLPLRSAGDQGFRPQVCGSARAPASDRIGKRPGPERRRLRLLRFGSRSEVRLPVGPGPPRSAPRSRVLQIGRFQQSSATRSKARTLPFATPPAAASSQARLLLVDRSGVWISRPAASGFARTGEASASAGMVIRCG